MSDVGKSGSARPRHAAVFGATGAIGAALCQALARGGVECIHAGSRSGQAPAHAAIRPYRFDLADEASIAAAAQAMREAPPELVIVASGVLTLEQGPGPEKSLRQIDPAAMAQVFAHNTIGPALVAKHLLPLLPRDRWSVFAVLSARVGSISDNRLGGWHSYRASKAALNMLIRNFAIEQARTHPQSAVVGLHPGTVDSALSAPFQSNLPARQLTAPDAAAAHLLEVIWRLRPEDSGKVFDWRGEEVPA